MTFLHKETYIIAFLLFCVASSKHIIIYNEELLVAGTFLAFVIYIHTAFGNSIKESIDENRNSILQELQSLAVHKKNGAIHLKSIHEKVPQIYKSLSTIEGYVIALISQIGDIATKTVNRVARQQIQLRCESSSSISFTSYQQTMSDSFLPQILVFTQKYKPGGKKQINSENQKKQGTKTAKKAIALLQKKNT